MCSLVRRVWSDSLRLSLALRRWRARKDFCKKGGSSLKVMDKNQGGRRLKEAETESTRETPLQRSPWRPSSAWLPEFPFWFINPRYKVLRIQLPINSSDLKCVGDPPVISVCKLFACKVKKVQRESKTPFSPTDRIYHEGVIYFWENHPWRLI